MSRQTGFDKKQQRNEDEKRKIKKSFKERHDDSERVWKDESLPLAIGFSKKEYFKTLAVVTHGGKITRPKKELVPLALQPGRSNRAFTVNSIDYNRFVYYIERMDVYKKFPSAGPILAGILRASFENWYSSAHTYINPDTNQKYKHVKNQDGEGILTYELIEDFVGNLLKHNVFESRSIPDELPRFADAKHNLYKRLNFSKYVNAKLSRVNFAVPTHVPRLTSAERAVVTANKKAALIEEHEAEFRTPQDELPLVVEPVSITLYSQRERKRYNKEQRRLKSVIPIVVEATPIDPDVHLHASGHGYSSDVAGDGPRKGQKKMKKQAKQITKDVKAVLKGSGSYKSVKTAVVKALKNPKVEHALTEGAGRLGEMVGSRVGLGSESRALARGLAGKILAKIRGNGDYEVSSAPEMNALFPGSKNFGADANARFETKDNIYTIANREFISAAATSSIAGGFSNLVIPMNPGLASSFPYLSRIAANFEQYRFKALVIEFQPTTSPYNANSAMGFYAMTTQMNVDSAPFSNYLTALNSNYAMSARFDKCGMFGVECKDQPYKWYYVRNDTVSDLTVTDFCNFQFIINPADSFPTDSIIGNIWVSYIVEMRSPIFDVPTSGFMVYNSNIQNVTPNNYTTIDMDQVVLHSYSNGRCAPFPAAITGGGAGVNPGTDINMQSGGLSVALPLAQQGDIFSVNIVANASTAATYTNLNNALPQNSILTTYGSGMDEYVTNPPYQATAAFQNDVISGQPGVQNTVPSLYNDSAYSTTTGTYTGTVTCSTRTYYVQCINPPNASDYANGYYFNFGNQIGERCVGNWTTTGAAGDPSVNYASWVVTVNYVGKNLGNYLPNTTTPLAARGTHLDHRIPLHGLFGTSPSRGYAAGHSKKVTNVKVGGVDETRLQDLERQIRLLRMLLPSEEHVDHDLVQVEFSRSPQRAFKPPGQHVVKKALNGNNGSYTNTDDVQLSYQEFESIIAFLTPSEFAVYCQTHQQSAGLAKCLADVVYGWQRQLASVLINQHGYFVGNCVDLANEINQVRWRFSQFYHHDPRDGILAYQNLGQRHKAKRFQRLCDQIRHTVRRDVDEQGMLEFAKTNMVPGITTQLPSVFYETYLSNPKLFQSHSQLNGNNGSWTNSDDTPNRRRRGRPAGRDRVNVDALPRVEPLPQQNVVIDQLDMDEIRGLYIAAERDYQNAYDHSELDVLREKCKHQLEDLERAYGKKDLAKLTDKNYQRTRATCEYILKKFHVEIDEAQKIYATLGGPKKNKAFLRGHYCEVRRDINGMRYLKDVLDGVCYKNVVEPGEQLEGFEAIEPGLYKSCSDDDALVEAIDTFTHLEFEPLKITLMDGRIQNRPGLDVWVPTKMWTALLQRYSPTIKLRVELVNAISAYVASQVLKAGGHESDSQALVDAWFEQHIRYESDKVNNKRFDGVFLNVVDKGVPRAYPMLNHEADVFQRFELGELVRQPSTNYTGDPKYDLRTDMIIDQCDYRDGIPVFKDMSYDNNDWYRTVGCGLRSDVQFQQYANNCENVVAALKRIVGARKEYAFKIDDTTLIVNDEMLDSRQCSWYEALYTKEDDPILDVLNVDRIFKHDSEVPIYRFRRNVQGNKHLKLEPQKSNVSVLVYQNHGLGMAYTWEAIQRDFQQFRQYNASDVSLVQHIQHGFKNAFDERVFGFLWNDISDMRYHYATLKHPKRKLRYSVYKKHQDELDIKVPVSNHKLKALLKNESAKPDKPGRLYVAYGDAVIQGPDCIPFLKRGHSIPYEITLGRDRTPCTVHILSERDTEMIEGRMHLDLETVMTDILKKLNTGKDFLYGLGYSDDSFIIGRLAGLAFHIDLDIKSCDSSNKFGVFAALSKLATSQGNQSILSEVYECTKTIEIENPGFRNNQLQSILVTPLTAFEGSGTKLTTSLNNHICGAILLSIFCTLISTIDEKPLNEFIHDAQAILQNQVAYGAYLCGMQMTAQIRSIGHIVFERIQFLKYSFTISGEEVYAFRNLGALFRNFGSIDGDLTGSQVGVTPKEFRTRPIMYWFELYCKRIVESMVHEPGNVLLNALRTRFDVSIPTSYINDQALVARYHLDLTELQDLAVCLSNLEIGTHVYHQALSQIYEVDYELKSHLIRDDNVIDPNALFDDGLDGYESDEPVEEDIQDELFYPSDTYDVDSEADESAWNDVATVDGQDYDETYDPVVLFNLPRDIHPIQSDFMRHVTSEEERICSIPYKQRREAHSKPGLMFIPDVYNRDFKLPTYVYEAEWEPIYTFDKRMTWLIPLTRWRV